LTFKYLIDTHYDREWVEEVISHRAATRCKWRGRTLPLPG
jgi:hypothetical protein